MTTQMIIPLAVVILMIVAIMSDKFSFGAPPLVACCVLVLTGTSSIESAFAGFIDPNVIMIAGFMAVMAALQKTSLMSQIQNIMGKLAAKGGYVAYVLLILVVMLGTSIVGGGNTAYYMLVLSIVSTIPYNKNLPNSKLMLPMGFATGRPIIPLNVAFFMGLAGSMLNSAGIQATISLASFATMVFFMSLAYLIWAMVAYKILPDHDITGGSAVQVQEKKAAEPAMPAWKEYCTYAAFVVSLVAMFMLDNLGEAGYIMPCICTAFLVLVGVFDFKEARANLFSPLILMMASVIGVANALADSGFTAMLGDAIAKAMGSNASPFALLLIFCLLTSTCATLTGASIGTLFVFAPIGIATCISLGLNPVGMACAVTVSAWGGAYLPIDGCPAMILGMGKYKLSQFLKFSIPMYLIQILGLVIGAMIAFPM